MRRKVTDNTNACLIPFQPGHSDEAVHLGSRCDGADAAVEASRATRRNGDRKTKDILLFEF